MTDKLRDFLNSACENEQLKAVLAPLRASKSKDEIVSGTIKAAKEFGVNLTEEDFEDAESAQQLSDDELEVVSAASGDRVCPGLYFDNNGFATLG